jgi:hypothetical protein
MAKTRTSQLEKHIQSAIEEFLQLQENLGHLVYQKNNTGAVRVERPGAKSSFVRFGKAGSPDFLVWRKIELGGHVTCQTLFIEVKTDVGQLSDDQNKYRGMIERLGGNYYVVRSFDEVKRLLL